jgi:hypothetical protein
VDKSKKIVSLFLSSALVMGISGCNDQPRYKTVYDQNGNPVQVIEEDDDDHSGGFFYWISSPFRGYSRPSTGITTGTSGGVVNPGNSSSPSETPQSGIVGRSPWASGSSSSSSSSTSGKSSGITSGAKGGIGSSGSSVS